MARIKARLVALPIFYKILVANSLIVVTGAVAGSSLTLAVAGSIGPTQRVVLIVFFAMLGTLVSLAVNFAVLKKAFSPLTQLGRTIDAVRSGNLNTRAQPAPFADPYIAKLTNTLNDMLDAIEHYRDRLQALSAEVVRAQEEERTRMARELHDTTGQLLTGLLLRLKALEQANEPAVRRTASDLLDLTARTMEEVRRTAVELRPPALDDLGLVASLRGYIADYAANTGIDARFAVQSVAGRLPSDVELVLYRVVQEALTNTAKHARARRVWVSLLGRGSHLEVRIEDDGCGFDVEGMLQSRERGLGLFGMRERISLLGGTFDIRSDAGTAVLANVPIEKASTTVMR